MLKAPHTIVFHFLVRPGHLDISAMWRLWISICHECQSIAFISEIPFVRPVGTLLQFHTGYERTSKWQTIDSWILMEKWPSWGRIRHPVYCHDTFPMGKFDIPISIAALKSLCLCMQLCLCVVHVWAINKDLSAHVTEVRGQCWAARRGPLLDSDVVDYAWLMA